MLRALVRRSVMRRGVQGGSTFWLVIGAFGVLRRGYQKLGRKQEAVVVGERLRRGDELLVRYAAPPSRQTRREVKEIARRNAAAEAARSREVAKLTERASRRGLRARKARKRLASLVRG